jgi:HEPN domain-containing protein
VAEADEWLAYARDDLDVARKGLEQGFAARIVAFHAEQAAEKAVKAALIAYGVAPPPVHDVAELLLRLPPESAVRNVEADPDALTQAAVKARYPDTAIEVTRERAEASLRDAELLVQAAETDTRRS